MTNELPEVGSRWTIDGANVTVDRTAKRGRGWQVWILHDNSTAVPVRLQDFRKKAKPA